MFSTKNVWADRHLEAFETPRAGFESALVHLVKGLREYAQAHLDAYDSPIGEDYVIGDEWENIAHGIHGLLTGEHGRLDGGSLSLAIMQELKAAGLPEEKGGDK